MALLTYSEQVTMTDKELTCYLSQLQETVTKIESELAFRAMCEPQDTPLFDEVYGG